MVWVCGTCCLFLLLITQLLADRSPVLVPGSVFQIMPAEHYMRFRLKEEFGLFVDFEFLTEMGSWGTD